MFSTVRSTLGLLLIVVCLFRQGNVSLFANDVVDDKTSMLSIARTAQLEYRRRLLSGISFRVTYHVVQGDEVLGAGLIERVVLQGRSRAVESQVLATVPTGSPPRLECAGNEYAFTLKRMETEQPWMVTNISTDQRGFLLRGSTPGLADLALEDLLLHRKVPVLDIEGIPVHQFFLDTGIVVDDIEKQTDGRVRIRFSGSAQTPTGPDRILGGTIWLMPEMSWAVDEYKLRMDTVVGKSVVTRRVEWTAAGDLPVPRRVVNRYLAEESERESPVENRWKFDRWQRRTFENERFRLGHYGLPEPGLGGGNGSASASRMRFWKLLIWGNVVGILLLGIAVWIRYRFKSR